MCEAPTREHPLDAESPTITHKAHHAHDIIQFVSVKGLEIGRRSDNDDQAIDRSEGSREVTLLRFRSNRGLASAHLAFLQFPKHVAYST